MMRQKKIQRTKAGTIKITLPGPGPRTGTSFCPEPGPGPRLGP